jgi:hypothetical protein
LLKHLIVALLGLAAAADARPQTQPPASQPAAGIGYASVDAAMQALLNNPHAQVRISGGWTVVADPDSNSVWMFAPPGDPAFPAVVKRTVKTAESGKSSMEMTMLCEGPRGPCDQLARESAEFTGQLQKKLDAGSPQR